MLLFLEDLGEKMICGNNCLHYSWVNYHMRAHKLYRSHRYLNPARSGRGDYLICIVIINQSKLH